MKRYYLFFVFLLLGNVELLAQPQPSPGPKVAFPSPQAAQLGKFGGYEINHSTGVANIVIPIYTIVTGDLTLPISLLYYYNGCKPSEEPGWIGLGWNLSAGGVITRIIKGNADEVYQDNNIHSQKIKTLVDASSPDFNYYQNLGLTGNEYDESEPDIFSFQFAGYSGKFVLDETGLPRIISDQKINISYQKSIYYDNIRKVITKWQIITEDGTIYTFDSFDISYNDENSNIRIPSAWYLTEIKNKKGHTLTFKYSDKNTNKPRLQVGRFESIQDHGNSGPIYTSSVTKNWTVEVYLEKIKGLFGEIIFNSEEYDSGPIVNYSSFSRKLNNIQIFNSYNDKIKQLDFKYEDISSFKLQLRELQELGAVPYKFEYYSLVNKGLHGDSKQVDAWGYFNGVNNSMIIPEIAGSDLEPRLDQTKYGSLAKITYPTGGYTSLEYEQNEYSYVNNTLTSKNTKTIDEYSYRWLNVSGMIQENKTISFVLNIPTRVDIKITSGDTSPTSCKSLSSNGYNYDYTTFELPAGSYSGNDLLRLPAFSPCNQVFSPCPEPFDRSCSYVPPQGYDIRLDVKVFRPSSISNKNKYGGIRIKKMTDSPNSTSTSSTTVYSYSMEQNTNLSSGVIDQEPINKINLTTKLGVLKYSRSSPFNPVSLNTLYYKQVTERKSDHEITHYFTSHEDKDDTKGKWAFTWDFEVSPNPTSGGSFTVQPYYELGSFQSYSFLRGLPKKIITKDLNGTVRSRTDITYDGYQTEVFKVAALYHEVLTTYFYDKESSGSSIPTQNKVFYGKAYYIIGGWPRKISETTTVYNSN